MKDQTDTLESILARNYTFVAEADQEDGGWVVYFPDLPGCVTQGDSFDEVAAMAEDAFRVWVAAQYEDGYPIPEPTYGKPHDWNWSHVEVDDSAPRFTVANVASQLNVTTSRVYALAKSRKVGTKEGGTILFSRKDIEAMRNRKPGRPTQKV